MMSRPLIASTSWPRMILVALLVLAGSGCAWRPWEPPDPYAPPIGSTGRHPPLEKPSPPGAPAPEIAVTTLPPVGAEPGKAESGTVTVAAGDTLQSLAWRHRVSVPALIAANKLEPPYGLRAGQRLTLPQDNSHRVAKGEDLFSIAAAHDIDPYLLAAENGLTRPFALREGQVLRLPKKGGPPSPASSRTAAEKTTSETEVAGLPHAPLAVKPPQAADADFIWPLQGRVISAFGSKGDGLHNDGINISARAGTPVRAVAAGTVAYAGNELRGFGNLVLIKHADGWVSAYAHAQALLVTRGEKVRQGQVIARVGNTGGVGEPQLHFELRRGKTAVDPARYLKPART